MYCPVKQRQLGGNHRCNNVFQVEVIGFFLAGYHFVQCLFRREGDGRVVGPGISCPKRNPNQI